MLTEQAQQANQVEDRHYSVFRGNARMTVEEAGKNGTSFQTWGEGNSMRFATVPMSYPSGANRVQTEHQVWFATTNSSELVQEQDPQLRKQRLMQAFGSWHHPIPAMMEATPVDEILLERAIAHKHCVPPVTNVKQVLQDLYNIRPKSTGSGPVMVFIGDAFMTVDPILAQGFTMGMEGAHALSNSVSSACNQQSLDGLAFDPYVLRQNLENRHEGREDRLVALLRATELVQALGQPPDYSVLGFLSKYVVRPAIRITPHSIKTPIFNSMLKYSLGK
jgi:2-polyprenyl-6-methoxyphenol hydroxylase-like FAD-dependent oxidoreductase